MDSTDKAYIEVTSSASDDAYHDEESWKDGGDYEMDDKDVGIASSFQQGQT